MRSGQDVDGPHLAAHDAGGVRGAQGAGDRGTGPGRLGGRQGTSLEHSLRGFAADRFHDDPREPAGSSGPSGPSPSTASWRETAAGWSTRAAARASRWGRRVAFRLRSSPGSPGDRGCSTATSRSTRSSNARQGGARPAGADAFDQPVPSTDRSAPGAPRATVVAHVPSPPAGHAAVDALRACRPPSWRSPYGRSRVPRRRSSPCPGTRSRAGTCHRPCSGST